MNTYHPDTWRKSARRACALLAGLPLLAWAQTAPAADDKSDEALKLDKFVVTGSLIPIAADTPAVPITVMTSADIERTGEIRDLTDILKKANPFFFGRNNLGAENANTRANGTNGAATVALRNRATLVLINGRRAALAPVAATGGATFIDVGLIPVSAVERIEVLADGASATYGTDAVSGVVNIILKTNYRGAEIGGSYGWGPDAGGYSTRRAYATMGAGNDKTQLTVTAEWRKTDPLYQYERPWGLNQFRTASFAGVVTPDGVNLYYLNPNLNAPPQNTDMTLAELLAAGIYSGPYDGSATQNGVARFFDLSERSTMFQKTARRSIAIAGEHKWNDHITAFMDVVVTASDTQSVLNAQPVTGNVTGANPNNPFNVTVQARNRFRPFPRIRSSESLGGRVIAGLRGSLGGSWSYEVATGLNRTTQLVRQINLIDAPAYNAAVLANVYNPFARVQLPGVVEGFLGTGYQNYVSRLVSFDARVTGDLFDLPAGPLQLGVSLETRKETLSMVNDRNDRSALWLGGTAQNPFAADQSVDGLGAELRVPIVGPAQSIPLANSLEVTLAARKDLYNSTTDPLVPKFSVRWMPFNDELVLRATYGESFTAPPLFNLYGPSNAGFSNNYDIRRYDTSGNPILLPNGNPATTGTRQSRARGGSNPNLVPSESRNWTAGIVWSPRSVKGLSLSLDWFAMDERDLVGAIPQATIFQDVERFGPASPYAHQIRIATSVAGETHFTSGAPVTSPGQISGNLADATWLTNPVLNIAGNWQSGADLRLDYDYDAGSLGKFKLSSVLTYIHEYVQQALPTTAPANFVDGFVGGGGASTFPRYRTFSTVEWTYKNLGVSLNHTYIPEVDDLAAIAEVPIDSYQTFDARMTYRFSGSRISMLQGLRVSVGVNNVLSEDPPFAAGEADQSRDINTYDAIGRFIYVSAAYKF
ncbi:MAG: hypothetical protein C0518_15645 [Opitutus sp.]|nr:hypothetical protein [Opitutus sp.]